MSGTRFCFSQLDAMHAAGATYAQLKLAVRHVEAALRNDAHDKGDMLSEGLCKIDVASVRAYFHANSNSRVVIIDGIRWIGDIG